MFCRICGAKIPEDSIFCPRCGEKVAVCQDEEAAPVQPEKKEFETRVFTFPDQTTYDQASIPINEWLSQNQLRILDARFALDCTLLFGTLVPTVSRLEVDWVADEAGRHYQLGTLIDSRNDFGIRKKQGAKGLQRQFDHWHGEHPELEVAGKQDFQMSLGWASAWVTVFFYR